MTEAADCEGRIAEEEIWETLKKVGTDKTQGINGLPYVYLRLSPMFVSLLEILFNFWFEKVDREAALVNLD